MYSNDPRAPRRKIEIHALVIPAVSVSPDRVFFNGFPEDDLRLEITIKTNRNEPLTLKPAKRSKTPSVTYRLQTLKKNRSFKLIVRNAVPKPAVYRERLVFKTNYQGRPFIVVPIFGRILDEVSVTPRIVDLGRIWKRRAVKTGAERPGPKTADQGRDVFVRFNTGENCKITSAKTAGNLLRTKIATVKPGKVYRIRLIPRLEKMKPGPAEITLSIRTDHKKFPFIEVPVRLTVK